MWSGQNNGSQHGHVTARMETSLPMGTPSISVSQHQSPKKFAPVVAPKPKFNPYKPPGDTTHDIAGKTTKTHHSWSFKGLKFSIINIQYKNVFICIYLFSRLIHLVQNDLQIRKYKQNYN